ncbi:sensor histidine kinase [Cytobacillus oceanisediminis]|uniref:sensor histidine kinase n=1 Tax=Cytobacillus oceanisediminis TaxID=665099 RepID=UPI001CCB75F1|nr:sensor histidine kinase [Cytobacillus oceanisediminis]MBQ6448496.1 sensor histidine kinase [Bacillus sp. (in: firmicutes)]MBZ9534136.1 sensor histidine kinase [Cytobacillus oceanisediminis]
MKNWLKWIDLFSIRTKMIVCFLALSLIPLLILGYLSYQYYINDLQNSVNVYTNEVIERVDKNIETYILDIENILEIYDDYYTIQYLRLNEAGDIDGIQKYTVRLWETIQLIKNMKSDLVDIRIISHTGETISAQGVYWSDRNDPFFANIRNIDEEEFVVKSPYIDMFNRNVFSIGKKILSPSLSEPAYLIIDIDVSLLNRIVNDIKLGEKGYVYFTDRAGEVKFFPVDTSHPKFIKELMNNDRLLNAEKGSFEEKVEGNHYLVNFKRSEITGWNIIGVTYADELNADINKIRQLTLVIAVGSLLVVVLISVYLTNILTNPIRDLRRTIKRFADDNLAIRAQVKTNDEIGQLASSFNDLMNRIQWLVQKTMDDQVKIRKIEMKALQELIKPHFVYNTLDSIIGLLEQERIEEALDLIEALGMFFRTSLSHGKDIILIDAEVEHIRNYFTIQKFRFFNRFDTKVEVDEEILNYETIKLILQPLVENAIYHGVRLMKKKGLIEIRGKEKEGVVVLEVIDNGVGMSAEKVNHINNVLTGVEKTEDENEYFGIRNVNERIKLTYGIEYGIYFKSKPNEGTSVTIILPIVKI